MNFVYVMLNKDYEGNISIHGVYSSEDKAEEALNKFKEEYKEYKAIKDYIGYGKPCAPIFPRKATEAGLNSYRSQVKYYNEKLEKFNFELEKKFGDKLNLVDKYKSCYVDPENCIIKRFNLDNEFIAASYGYKI